MSEKIVIGNISKGLKKDVTPFNIDNDNFPVLQNAYQWRGRVKRKRGTEPFSRLTFSPIGDFVDSPPPPSYYNAIGTTNGSGAIVSYNLVTEFSLSASNPIAPNSISIIIIGSPNQTFTDDGQGNLSNGSTGTGTINYATGIFSLQTDPALDTADAYILFSYYPSLPVLGLEPFVSDNTAFPQEVGFDTTYSYNISLAIGSQNIDFSPYQSWNVSYYNNPATDSYPDYDQKTDWTPLNWNLASYQQVWTTNYQGAMWAIPGVTSPFVSGDATVGMQFKPIVRVTVDSGTTATLNIVGHGLVVGDFVFVNEVSTTTGINFETGYVITVTDGDNVVVKFPEATLATNGTGGIAQYLTSSADPTIDCIRWYNGIPVSGTIPPSFSNAVGWVNFMPPLTSNQIGNFSIGDLPPSLTPYYLVSARIVVPFKDRLLFFGPVIQTSTGDPIYLQDTVIYSQNGTPYYTCSFPYDDVQPSLAVLATVSYYPILLPINQTATATSWWENATGFGGFLSAGYSRPITTVSINEDALIVGLTDRQTRLLYTGNDIVPFNFFVINSELGSDATFSSITLDRGVITMGGRGVVLTSQIASQRIDLDIPDEIFRIDLTNNGSYRICAQRDFINEWIYFTYPYLGNYNIFPNITLQYNYRDGSWAQFLESYTTYGTVRPLSGYIWSTLPYATWDEWSDPWNSGQTNERQPQVIAGNAQGFVILRATSTDESPSAFIQSISGNLITSPNHMLNQGDFIQITDCLGTVGQILNGKIFEVGAVTTTTFAIVEPPVITGTYLGNGLITRLYKPLIQTKEFNPAWSLARKTRIGVQQYLFSYTSNAQITLLIYLSQSENTPSNDSAIVPDPLAINNALIYSTVLYTCPESTNLGLTPVNTNLQMPTAQQQQQIWHRMNTSLIGDTVQIGFTLSDDQMRTYIPSLVSFNITAATNAYPCVITSNGQFAADTLVMIQDVEGMEELNFDPTAYNYYQIISSTPIGIDLFEVALNIDSTTFGVFTTSPDATVTQVNNPNPTAEIEFHGCVIDINPSSLLA